MKVREKGKIRKWLEKRKNIIIIVGILWGLLIAVNYFLASQDTKEVKFPKTSYSPNFPIISEKYEIPEKEQNNVESIINSFILCCNEKKYNEAYLLVSQKCKEEIFDNSFENFEVYIKDLFDEYKLSYIQNLSNDKNNYVYNLKLFDDYLSLGLKSEGDLYYKEQEICVFKENNEYKISLKNFISQQDVNKEYSDDYINIKVIGVKSYYKTEEYTINVTNNSDYTVVLKNGFEGSEILLDVENDKRETYVDTLDVLAKDVEIVLKPHETQNYSFSFLKYFDEYKDSNKLIFNKIRVMNEYSGEREKYQEELQKAIKKYSFEIDLKK